LCRFRLIAAKEEGGRRWENGRGVGGVAKKNPKKGGNGKSPPKEAPPPCESEQKTTRERGQSGGATAVTGEAGGRTAQAQP